MVNLRCAKCGSDSGFLLATTDGKTLEVGGPLSTDRIRKTVGVTCTYCNNQWDHVPITVQDARVADPFQRRVMH